MVIVKHIESGLYYKKGNFRSKWDNGLVTKDKATVYRNRAGAVMSVGRMVFEDKPRPKRGCGTFKFLHSHYVLDETVWEIVPIEIK